MNFFEHQAQARRKSIWLVILFSLAVIILITLTDLLLVLILLGNDLYPNLASIPIDVHTWTAGIITIIILLATTYRLYQLNQGGSAVAIALGGRLIHASTQHPQERKLLNIVEEMAIASGTPVPLVYLIEDNAINAFAAGYGPHDAIIGVTRGAIEILNREELQGVIAHEFSHIFNGDMRLNLRLIGILFGILFIALAGHKLLRYPLRSRGDERAVVFLLGLGLVIIGYSGAFFSGLIRAAICRQREYLADAAAVQFTRNPEGIGNALKKIGGWKIGSILMVPNAAEYSHFYFAQGIGAWTTLFPTHPPLKDRVKRIQPDWDGIYPSVERPQSFITLPNEDIVNPQQNKRDTNVITTAALAAAIAQTGAPTSEHLQDAKRLLQTLSTELLNASHDPQKAHALALSLMLNRDPQQWQAQLDVLDAYANPGIITTIKALLPKLSGLHPEYRLTLIDLCLPQLKLLSATEKMWFKDALKRLINADQKFELWEWALYSLFLRAINKPVTQQSRYHDIKQLESECRLILAALIYGDDLKTGADAFRHVAKSLDINPAIPEKTQLRRANLNEALTKLNLLAPLQKPKLLKALRTAAEHNGVISLNEAELIRAIAECIDCPMPLLPGFSRS